MPVRSINVALTALLSLGIASASAQQPSGTPAQRLDAAAGRLLDRYLDCSQQPPANADTCRSFRLVAIPRYRQAIMGDYAAQKRIAGWIASGPLRAPNPSELCAWRSVIVAVHRGGSATAEDMQLLRTACSALSPAEQRQAQARGAEIIQEFSQAICEATPDSCRRGR